ncbi:hypothetical protein RIF29_33529 [Crotalaria pallida]|uniref:Uncharacterized protein n=1 Tax=Crotalaria pallida TaxID=3830 RepID=A0AAN9EA42_CROPI
MDLSTSLTQVVRSCQFENLGMGSATKKSHIRFPVKTLRWERHRNATSCRISLKGFLILKVFLGIPVDRNYCSLPGVAAGRCWGCCSSGAANMRWVAVVAGTMR